MSDRFRFNGVGLEIGIPLSDSDGSAISQWAENAADLARKHEQERIIKLLEQRATLMGKCKDTECVCRQSAIDFEYAIELIKGETK